MGYRNECIDWPPERSSKASYWSPSAIRALLLQCRCLLQFIRVSDVGSSGGLTLAPRSHFHIITAIFSPHNVAGAV